MAINYRSAPMIFRRPDPSCWFSSLVRSQVNFAGDKGEPDTPIIPTYPSERLRIRLIQGSHEEQHGFTMHGLRWRRDWGHPDATLVNQQSLGISEAFTLDINPAVPRLMASGTICGAPVQSPPPIASNFALHAPLPNLTLSS